MQKIRKNSVLFLALIAILILGFPAYAENPEGSEGSEGQAPPNLEQTQEGNSSTGDGSKYVDPATNCNYQAGAGQLNARNKDAGMNMGAADGGSKEENSQKESGETSTATVSGSVPRSYTSTREKVGETQTIVRNDGTSGTIDTYDIGGDSTQIVISYNDGSDITITLNSDGTTMAMTNGQYWTTWFQSGDDSGDSSSGSSGSSSPAGKSAPDSPASISGKTPEETPQNKANLYEYRRDNVTGRLTSVGTIEDGAGRTLDLTIVVKGEEEKVEKPERPSRSGSGLPATEGDSGDGSDGSEVVVNGKRVRIAPGGSTGTGGSATPGADGSQSYRDLQNYANEISKIEGGKTVTIGKDGKVTITQEFDDKSTKTWELNGEGKIEYDYTIKKADGTLSKHHRTVSVTHETEHRPTFVGYDWTVENLTDPYSPFYMSPTSFTTPGMRERQYEDGPIFSGGLLPVGEGYLKKDGAEYWFVNYGDHTCTVTPWWNIDVYECWEEETTDTDDMGVSSTTTEYYEEYEYSYKESRPPKVYEFNIPLVCIDCPIPAKGYRACIGGNCDCIGTSDELMTVCDEQHTVELDIETRVELEQ